MTTNIIAEISSSLNSDGTFKQYQVVAGSTFTDAYNEELDSASIILAQVPYEDRIVGIKPYDFVRVYDASSWDGEKYTFDHVYLVDNYYEKEERITDNRLFSYTINLMSETKLLEKIQCPNLTITHNLDESGNIVKKTIYEHICEYMELYIPKIKMYNSSTSKWEYKRVIEIPGIKTTQYVTVSEQKEQSFEETIEDEPASLTISAPDLIDYNLINVSSVAVVTLPENGKLSVTSTSFNSQTGNFTVMVRNTKGIRLPVEKFKIIVSFDKVLGEKHHYSPDINDYYHLSIYNKFNVPCADISESKPTMRQLLNSLMIQIGCIPTVNNLKLGFLDFNDDAGNFVVDDTINYFSKSLSSDSFVNTLINDSENVLDSENYVVSELLGFRDRNNVALKQQENLVLETRFPIFKVESFSMNCMLNNALSSTNECEITWTDNDIQDGLVTFDQGTCTKTRQGNKEHFVVSFKSNTSRLTTELDLTSICTVKSYNYNSTTKKFTHIANDTVTVITTFAGGGAAQNVSFNFDINRNFDYCIVDLNMTLEAIALPEILFGNGKMEYPMFGTILNGPIMASIPITPLIVEQQQRVLLESNFANLHGVTTIEELAKFKYGTVGYTIGSNQISGFSDYYSEVKAMGLFTYSYGQTYIEAIYEWLKQYYLSASARQVLNNGLGIELEQDSSVSIDFYNPNAGDNFIKFTQFTFDVKYQPLNSFNLSFIKSKEDIPLSLEQYNSNASGLTDFDRLSINNQETVDRVGNDTMSISQRLKSNQFSQIRGGINFKPTYLNRDGIKYTIFKRTYTIDNYCFNINYTASKDAILKNYFTSIRTKYRAYSYVDYNQSVLRKEKDVIFVRIGEGEGNYYNGDDKIYWDDDIGTSGLLTGASPLANYNSLKYNIEHSVGYNFYNITETSTKEWVDEYVKNDVSLITNDNCFAIIYEQFDNVSAGPFIRDVLYTTYYDFSKTVTEEGRELTPAERKKIGGVPQTWQKWKDDLYSDNHQVIYTNFLNYYDKSSSVIVYGDETSALTSLATAARAPVVLEEVFSGTIANNLRFYLVDNNNAVIKTKTFYKDGAERLNHTVQFVYYSVSDNIVWTEKFIGGNAFINKNLINPNAIYSTNMTLDKNLHTPNAQTEAFISNDLNDYITLVAENEETGEAAHIEITWNDKTAIKLCYKDPITGQISDFIAFRKPNDTDTTTKFYVTLNDTKSDYVMSVRNGVLYRSHKVKTNNMNREVDNL